jgi:outer membrane protein
MRLWAVRRVRQARSVPTALVGLAAALAGCATSALDLAPPEANRPWEPATTPSGEIIPGMPPNHAGAGTSGFVLPKNEELARLRPAARVEPGKVYTLSELIDLAEATNPLTRTAWNTAREAALAVGIVRSTYLPRLAIAALGGGQWLNNQQSGVLGTSVNNQVTGFGTVSTASLQWLLFDFGERAALIDAAQQASIVSNIAFTAAHQQVIYDVSLAFYAYAAARERQGIANQSLSNARSVQSAADARLRQQEGTVVETAQARQAAEQAELERVRAEGAAQDAYLALITAVGVSPTTKIRIADVSDRRLSPAAAQMTETAIAGAVGRRADVLAAYALEKQSTARVRAAEAEFLPKIFASGNVAYSNGRLSLTAVPAVGDAPPSVNLAGHGFASTIIAGITVPIYDGGTRAALLEQAKTRAESANIALEHRQDEAARQIVLSDNAVRTSVAAYMAASALTTAAETTFDAALSAYRDGVGSITTAILAQSALLQARQGKADAYSAALTAAATLAFATGTLGSSPQ